MPEPGGVTRAGGALAGKGFSDLPNVPFPAATSNESTYVIWHLHLCLEQNGHHKQAPAEHATTSAVE